MEIKRKRVDCISSVLIVINWRNYDCLRKNLEEIIATNWINNKDDRDERYLQN